MDSFRSKKIATNPVTEKLRGGQPCVGSWLTLCSPVAAESMANMGWDWLVVDVQHSPVGFETMLNCFRAIQLGGAVPLARVPWNETIWIQRTLDAGALGLVVPMVNSRADAEATVSNMRYATRGQRSYTTSRVAAYLDVDYRTWADDNLAVIVMIETIQAVEQAEAILSVDGVVGCFIGPNDLALSMGITMKETGPGTEHEAAMLHVLEAAKKVGRAAGKHCFTAGEVSMRIGQGFQFLALASDGAFLAKAAQAELNAVNFAGTASASAQDLSGKLY